MSDMHSLQAWQRQIEEHLQQQLTQWQQSQPDLSINKLIDQDQVQAFELVQAHAQCQCMEFVLNAMANDQLEPWVNKLLLLYIADTLHNLTGLLPAQQWPWSDFCRQQRQGQSLSALGQQVIANKGYFGSTGLNEDHRLMKETFMRLANEVVKPRAQDIHQHNLIVPDEILDQVREMGCFGLSIPQCYGGLQDDHQEDPLAMIVVTEALSQGSLAAAGSLITRPEILARALLKGGTEQQKQAWLPRLAMGDPLCAVAVTEPDHGSDVAAMKLRAIRQGDNWCLNGSKTWCTFAGKAGVLMVLARTDPDPAAGHKGLSMFLVEKPTTDGEHFSFDLPQGGRLSGRAIPTMGYRGMHSFELFFDQVMVPASHLLGGEQGLGQGFYFTMAGFAGGRIQTAARAIGLMQAAFEQGLNYAQERKVFGQPIAQYGLTQAKLARIAAHLMACRLFTYGVGHLMEKGGGDMEASLVKLFTCRSAEWITREAMQIHGGMGYAEESPASRYYADARVLSIFEGTEEVLALKVIAPALLKKGLQ